MSEPKYQPEVHLPDVRSEPIQEASEPIRVCVHWHLCYSNAIFIIMLCVFIQINAHAQKAVPEQNVLGGLHCNVILGYFAHVLCYLLLCVGVCGAYSRVIFLPVFMYFYS